MRQAIALTVVVALGLLVSTAPAGAASTKKGPTLKSLQAQITSLQKQVKTLKTRVTETEDVALFGVVYGVCSTAVVADTFEDTWEGLDSYFGAHSLPAFFGAQLQLNDYQACQAIKIARAIHSKPPSTVVLHALLDLFKSSAAAQQLRADLTDRYALARLFVLPR